MKSAGGLLYQQRSEMYPGAARSHTVHQETSAVCHLLADLTDVVSLSRTLINWTELPYCPAASSFFFSPSSCTGHMLARVFSSKENKVGRENLITHLLLAWELGVDLLRAIFLATLRSLYTSLAA